jgi:transketolase
MGAAALAFTVWTRHLRHNPRNPLWAGRDRFILSGGHGSMLLYSLLHLSGYELSIEELKSFRQWGSKTPGHPERGLTAGVETTTGPLGQGFATGVGMAIAQAHLAAEFAAELFDHYIYGIVTDGDLMEGVASEAASLAGHLGLGRIIYLYDDNHISIDGSTELAFTEDRLQRFAAYNWHVQQIDDGNDVEAIDAAIGLAKQDPRPSLIGCRTHIGFGAPHKQDTAQAHGEPLGDEELDAAKTNLGWPIQPRFLVPEDVLAFFRRALAQGQAAEAEWDRLLDAYAAADASAAADLRRRLRRELPVGWDTGLPFFAADDKGMATRAASGKVLGALAGKLPELMGGSADLTPSNNTRFDGGGSFQSGSPRGRYVHFGVREHAMAAALNGMTLYGGVIAYAGTFLVFSDYMRPAIRIAALSGIPSIFVFTHDSVGLGEDGPTHQPIEHLAALRAIPNLLLVRPADANEVAEAWRIAISRTQGPTALALTRQSLPVLDRTGTAPAASLARGAYVLEAFGENNPDIVLLASGSEVGLIHEAGRRLLAKGYSSRVVSFPCWALFEQQPADYRESVLPRGTRLRLAVEAGVAQGWERYVGPEGKVLSIERYGASAPYKVIFENLGFTVESVVSKAESLLEAGPLRRTAARKRASGAVGRRRR